MAEPGKLNIVTLLVVAAVGAGIWAGARYVPGMLKERNAEKLARLATSEMFLKHKAKDKNLAPVEAKLKTDLAALGITDPQVELDTNDPDWVVVRVRYDQPLSFPTATKPVFIEAKTDTKPVKL